MNIPLTSRIKALLGKNEPLRDMGFLIRESAEEFAAREESSVTFSALEAYADNPLLYRKIRAGLIPKESERKNAARGARIILLDGRDAFDQEYTVCHLRDKAGKLLKSGDNDFYRWKAEQTKIPLDYEDAGEIESLVDSVKQHPLASTLLATGESNGTVLAEVEGVRCASRVAPIHPELGLVHLAFHYSMPWSKWNIRRDAYRAVFDATLIGRVTGKYIPAHIIIVETQQPHRCGVWKVSWFSHRDAEKRNAKLLRALRNSYASNSWPGGFEQLRSLDWVLPSL